jgi:hypothetical protein
MDNILPAIVLIFLLFFGGGLINALFGWSVYRLVLRGYRIGFEPIDENEPINSDTLSGHLRELLLDDPKFAVIIGRPAGLFNFLREFIGLGRRFEFVLSRNQATTRYGSLTSQSLKLSKLGALGAITVDRSKRNPLLLFLQWAVLNALISRPSPLNDFNPGGGAVLIGLFLTVWFIGYYILTTVTEISLIGDKATIKFIIFPPLLERLSGHSGLDMPLADANRLAQIFRVLKDQ